MKLNYMEWVCPACGRNNKDACSTWGYDTPIRHCAHCQAEHLDKRWREVAIDGYDPRSTDGSFYLKGTLLFAVFAIVMAFVVWHSIRTRGSYSIRSAGCIVLGVFGSVMCLILYLRIKLGFEAKRQEKYMEESIARLRDPAYVQKLMDYGYEIPEEYRRDLPSTTNDPES